MALFSLNEWISSMFPEYENIILPSNDEMIPVMLLSWENKFVNEIFDSLGTMVDNTVWRSVEPDTKDEIAGQEAIELIAPRCISREANSSRSSYLCK